MILKHASRLPCLVMLVVAQLGAWATASAQGEMEPIYGTIEGVDATARRILLDGQAYALTATTIVQWQDGRPLELSSVEPAMRAAVVLVSATAEHQVPQIRVLTLQLD